MSTITQFNSVNTILLQFKDININNVDALAIADLAKSYNVLDYHLKLKALIGKYFKVENLEGIPKPDLHRLINETLLAKYKGEITLKSFLVKEFINRNVTAAFEIRVNTSRVDFLIINGDTKSFEIKSKLDNLTKLGKQVNDYQKVFEYNYILIDEKHYDRAIKIIPSEYGIWCFENGKKVVVREATKNIDLKGDLQLKLFTKKELSLYFKDFNSSQEILKNFDFAYVNKVFKLMLKKRYAQRWQFLKSYQDSIFPMDYQFFFNSNVDPKIIYNC